MKLVTAIVQDQDAGHLVKTLVSQGYRATRLDSHGGFLHARNCTILVGVADDGVADVLATIRSTCHSREQQTVTSFPVMDSGETFAEPVEVTEKLGGATVFVLPIEQYVQV